MKTISISAAVTLLASIAAAAPLPQFGPPPPPGFFGPPPLPIGPGAGVASIIDGSLSIGPSILTGNIPRAAAGIGEIVGGALSVPASILSVLAPPIRFLPPPPPPFYGPRPFY